MNSLPGRVLGISRLCVGVVSLLAPGAAAGAFGVDRDRSSRWVTRLFGSRELVLAALLLTADEPRARTVALLGAAIDGTDALSSAVEFGQGRISPYTGLAGGGGAVLFAALGLLAARARPAAT